MRFVKYLLPAALLFAFGTAEAGKSALRQAAGHGSKLIQKKEGVDSGREAFVLGVNKGKESVFMMTIHQNGGKDDFKFYDYVLGNKAGKPGENKTPYVREVKGIRAEQAKAEILSTVGQMARTMDGKFTSYSFSKKVQTRIRGSQKRANALRFTQKSQSKGRTARVIDIYKKPGRRGITGKVVDNMNGRRVSRWGQAARRASNFK